LYYFHIIFGRIRPFYHVLNKAVRPGYPGIFTHIPRPGKKIPPQPPWVRQSAEVSMRRHAAARNWLLRIRSSMKYKAILKEFWLFLIIIQDHLFFPVYFSVICFAY
jgi:hypothetical protein